MGLPEHDVPRLPGQAARRPPQRLRRGDGPLHPCGEAPQGDRQAVALGEQAAVPHHRELLCRQSEGGEGGGPGGGANHTRLVAIPPPTADPIHTCDRAANEMRRTGGGKAADST